MIIGLCGAGKDTVANHIHYPPVYSDFTIQNDGSLEELKSDIDYRVKTL